MNILIIKPGAIGDLLHMTPVIRALRRRYPDARISIMVGTRVTASLFQNNPDVHETILFEKKGAHRSGKALLGLWRRIREGRYDLVLNYQRSNLKVWFLLTGLIPCRVLTYRKARGRVVHAVVNHLETLAPLGIDPAAQDLSLVYNPSEADERYADMVFETHGLAGKPVVAFNPGTAHTSKCWPTASFARLGDRLAGELGMRVIVFGSEHERPLKDEIERAMHHPIIDLTGCTLGELAAVLKRVLLLVTGDTGPMHMSAAVGTPAVALFGPISPDRSGPIGAGHRVIMHRELPCCPCNRFDCRHVPFRECMEMITVDEVFDAVVDVAASRGWKK